MKKILYPILLALLSSISATAQIDSIIIFRPGPGLNDSTDEGGLNSGKDAFVVEDPATNNYGDHPTVYSLPVSNCNQTHVLSFIKFDLTTLPDTVDSVFVVFRHIEQINYCYSNCAADFYFAAVTQAWNEQTVNYSNQPPHDTAFYGPIPISFPDTAQTRRFNITGMYNLWKLGALTNNGFAIYSPTVGCNNAAISFYAYGSDDTTESNRPYLEVHFTVDTTTTNGVRNILAEELELKTYPNPATNELNISFNMASAGETTCTITDLAGRIIKTKRSNTNTGRQNIKIPIQGLAPGLYCYRLETNQGIVVQKFIKQ